MPNARQRNSDKSCHGKTIIIDPVTRIEGHSKISLHLDEQGHVEESLFPRHAVSRFREILRRPPLLRDAVPHGAHLRHLPGEPSDRVGQSLRRDPGRAHPAQRRAPAPQSSTWRRFCSPTRSASSISRSPTCCSAWIPTRRRATSSASCGPIRRWPGTASACGSSASRSSSGWPANASIPRWVVPGGVNEPSTAENRDRILAGIPEAHRHHLTHSPAGSRTNMESLPRRDPHLRQFPHPLHGARHFRRPPRTTTTATFVSSTPSAKSSPIISLPQAIPNTSAKPSSHSPLHKFPYYLPLGYPDGVYRVGPLARLNLIDNCGTPRASQEWVEFRELVRGTPS